MNQLQSTPFRKCRTALAAGARILTAPLLSWLLYARILTFPFYWDDVLNFNWMRGRSIWSLWVDSSGYSYYRPLTFTVWRVLQVVFGRTNAQAFQALDLLIVIAIGWLLMYLTAQAARDGAQPNWKAGWLAGAMAAAYPFAAQVVPNVGSAFHIYAPAALLAACAALARYRQTGRRQWAAAAVAAGLLAPAVHEMLVVTGAVLALWLLLDRPISSRWHGWPVVAVVTLGNALWLPWWLSVPKTGGEGLHWLGWESIFQSTAYFAQGLSFPLQPLARVLMNRWGWADIWASLGLAGVGLALAGALLIGRGQWRLLALGLGWYAVCALPTLLGLGFHYVVGNLRFMTFPAPGAIMLWSATVFALAPRRWPTPVRAATIAALTLLTVGPAGLFVREQMRLHTLALGQVSQLAQIARLHPDEKQLVINPLDWIASRHPRYALGHEAVEVLPAYLPLGGLASTNSGAEAQIDPIQFSNIRPELPGHWYNVAAADTDWQGLAARLPEYERIWLTRYSDERIDIVEAGHLEAGAKPPAAYVAAFGEQVILVNARVQIEDGEARVELEWYPVEAASGEIFRHVLDCTGSVLGLGDGPAFGGAYPVWAWRPGDRITDIRRISLTGLPPDGCFSVEVGLFDPNDGSRRPATDAGGHRLENDVVTVTP